VKIGVVGCGVISKIYLENCHQRFPSLEVVALADLDLDRARTRAEEFGIANVLTVEELVTDKEVELVLNLTPPSVHAQICRAAMEQGKHCYVEKPLSIELSEGRELVALAQRSRVRLGAAPDTFLGGGLQTTRKLIDDGWIGRPVAFSAAMLGHGPERWHPSPEFFYQKGGGPLFDMGPYYLTALINLLGPIARIRSADRISFSERVITTPERFGATFPVEIPTHVVSILEMESGVVGTLTVSFDVWGSRSPRIEIHGSDGTISAPDPNTFGGPVEVFRPDAQGWAEVPLTHGYAANSRGIGVLEIAHAVESDMPHRAGGALALHVLEAMHGCYTAAHTEGVYEMSTTVERPAPLRLGLLDGQVA
jgi:predicted dehydrogenase